MSSELYLKIIKSLSSIAKSLEGEKKAWSMLK